MTYRGEVGVEEFRRLPQRRQDRILAWLHGREVGLTDRILHIFEYRNVVGMRLWDVEVVDSPLRFEGGEIATKIITYHPPFWLRIPWRKTHGL